MTMSQITTAILLAAGAFVGMILLLELGRAIGARALARDPTDVRAGTGTIEGAVFALLGLLIAFTFSGAAARFDARRHLIIDEANAIGTAYLRLDLAAPEAQPGLRELFRRYLDKRLETYRLVPDLDAVAVARAEANGLQGEIWKAAVAGTRAEGATPAAPMLLLPALNQMFDIAATRFEVTGIHPPGVVWGMLIVFALGSAFLAGHAMAPGRHHRWLHTIGFAAVVGLSIYVILDLEYPRMGLIRVDSFDDVLATLRRSIE